MTIAFFSAVFWFSLDVVLDERTTRRLIRTIVPSVRGSKDFYPHGIIHHTIVSVGALYVLIAESYAHQTQPQRSFLCLPPLAAPSEWLPPFSLGYGVHDVADGIRRKDISFVIQ